MCIARYVNTSSLYSQKNTFVCQQLYKTWSPSSCCCLYSPLAFQYPAWVNCCSTWTRPSLMTHSRWKRTSWISVRVLQNYNFWNCILKDWRSLKLFIYSAVDYMAHLVEVQHERGATGGHTFHSLLSSSLPLDRGWWLKSPWLFMFNITLNDFNCC